MIEIGYLIENLEIVSDFFFFKFIECDVKENYEKER